MDLLTALSRRAKLVVLFLFCACIIQPIMNLIWLGSILTGNERAWKMFVSFDRHGNAATNGNPDETVSERAYRGTKAGSRGWCVLCRVLDFFDKGHCARAGAAVDGVRAATIQESSSPESTHDFI